MSEAKALNVSGLSRVPRKITVPKWDSKRYLCTKWDVVDRRQCTPQLSIRAMLLIQLMIKNTLQQQNSMWCLFSANVFWEFLLLQVRDLRLIFLLSAFSKRVNISVLSFCMSVGLPVFLWYIFHSFDWTFSESFCLPLMFGDTLLLYTVEAIAKREQVMTGTQAHKKTSMCYGKPQRVKHSKDNKETTVFSALVLVIKIKWLITQDKGGRVSQPSPQHFFSNI